MSEMPKKIFLDAELDVYTSDFQGGCLTNYIRADLVDELVTALKTAHCWTSKKIHEQHTAPLIEGALSKLGDILEDKK